MQPLAVVSERLAVRGELADARPSRCRSGAGRPPASGFISSGSSRWTRWTSKRRSSSARTPRSKPAGSRKSEMTTTRPGLARPHRVVRERLVQAAWCRPAARRPRKSIIGRIWLRPRVGGQPSATPLAQDAHATRSWLTSPTKPSAAASPHGVGELGGRAEVHRGRGVHEQVQAEILLVHEELDVQAVEATVDVPVDVAEVVAVPVGAVVGELHAVAAARAASLALDAAPERPPGQRAPGARAARGTPG